MTFKGPFQCKLFCDYLSKLNHFGPITNVQPDTYHVTEMALNCNKHFVSLGENRNVAVLNYTVT